MFMVVVFFGTFIVGVLLGISYMLYRIAERIGAFY